MSDYLEQFISDDEKLMMMLAELRQRDEFKHAYLSPFEALQANEWLKTNFFKDDKLNLIKTILALTDKDAGLYVDSFGTMHHLSIATASVMDPFEDDACIPPIGLSYYNPNKSILELKTLLELIGNTRIDNNVIIIKPEKGSTIEVKLISKEKALELGEIIDGPINKLIDYCDSPSDYLSKQRKDINALVESIKVNLHEPASNSIVEVPNCLADSVNPELINEIETYLKEHEKEFSLKDRYSELSDDEKEKLFEARRGLDLMLTARGVFSNPLFYRRPGDKSFGKITLYRYIKPE